MWVKGPKRGSFSLTLRVTNSVFFVLGGDVTECVAQWFFDPRVLARPAPDK
jgi:hypothetical protein